MKTLTLFVLLSATAFGQSALYYQTVTELPTAGTTGKTVLRTSDSTLWQEGGGPAWVFVRKIAYYAQAGGGSPPDTVLLVTKTNLDSVKANRSLVGHTHAGFTELYRTSADTTFAAINAGMKVIGMLQFDMVANGVYEIDANITFGNVAATTTGFALGFTGPASSVAALTAQIPNAADGVGGEWQGWLNGAADSTVSTATPVTSVWFSAYVFGRIYNGANAGAFRLTWRPEAAANMTVRQWSVLRYRKVN